jgi:hypothetical protein
MSIDLNRIVYLESLNVGGNGEPVPIAVNGSLQVTPLVLNLRLLTADMLSLRSSL